MVHMLRSDFWRWDYAVWIWMCVWFDFRVLTWKSLDSARYLHTNWGEMLVMPEGASTVSCVSEHSRITAGGCTRLSQVPGLHGYVLSPFIDSLWHRNLQPKPVTHHLAFLSGQCHPNNASPPKEKREKTWWYPRSSFLAHVNLMM